MRGGYHIHLVEAVAGALEDMRVWLMDHRYTVTCSIAEASDELMRADIRCFDLQSAVPLKDLATLVRIARRTDGAVLGLAHESQRGAASKALAIGCDDLQFYPFEEIELVHRLDCQGNFAQLRIELDRRSDVALEFTGETRNTGSVASRSPRQRKQAVPPKVLAVGPASQQQVMFADAWRDAKVTFCMNTVKALRLLEEQPFDIILATATNKLALRDAGAWPIEIAGPSQPVRLLAYDPHQVVDLNTIPQGFHDYLSLPMTAEQIRLRLAFWHSSATFGQRLRQHGSGQDEASLADSVTQTYNYGFFCAYARQRKLYTRGHPYSALIVARIVNLLPTNVDQGYAAGNRMLRTTADLIQLHIRNEDLLAHMGGGRFAIWLQDASQPEAQLTLRRLVQAFNSRIKTDRYAPALSAEVIKVEPFLDVERAVLDGLNLLDRTIEEPQDNENGQSAEILILPTSGAT